VSRVYDGTERKDGVFMQLDTSKPNLFASARRYAPGRCKLMLDYPEGMHDRVMMALSDLLRPCPEIKDTVWKPIGADAESTEEAVSSEASPTP
jgi:hypothetical protein